MKNKEFKILLNKVHDFNNYQFRKLKEEIEIRVKKKRVANILETPIGELQCPYCNSKRFILWGKRNDMQRYKCKNCCKTFNCLTNTPLARLRRKGHWLNYADCLKNEMTIRKAANQCGIHKNTSFRWRHRFIDNLKEIKAKKLGGIIEAGELILKESFKGNKNLKKENSQKRKDVYILYGVDRNNNIYDITNKGFDHNIMNREFENIIIPDSLIVSEKRKVLLDFTKRNNLKHIMVKNNNHDLSHVSNLDSYKVNFKDWITDYFRGVATKYLENYVSWYRTLNEFHSGVNALTLLYRAKSIEKYRHQPLKVTRFI